jgi:hypothetical protein
MKYPTQLARYTTKCPQCLALILEGRHWIEQSKSPGLHGSYVHVRCNDTYRLISTDQGYAS